MIQLRSPLLSVLVWPSAVALVALTGHLLGGSSERTVVLFLITLTASAGMSIYCGNSGVLSFGHLAFMAVGAYVTGLMTLPLALKGALLPHLPLIGNTQFGLPAGIAAALLLAVLLAALSGLLIARLENASATIATLGLLIIVHGVIVGARDITRGSQSFFGVPRHVSLPLVATVAALAIVLARAFRDSVTGLRLRASRDDALAARSIGIRVEAQRWAAWIVSAAPVALSGALLAHYLGTFSPQRFYFTDTFPILAMLIVGGIGSVTGAVVGTVLITFIGEVMRHVEGGVSIGAIQLPPLYGAAQISVALAILLTMWFRRDGLAGAVEWDERLAHSSLPVASTPEPARMEHAEPQDASDAQAMKPQGTAANLQARHLSRAFGGLKALDDVTLELRQNEILGIIGPNGSGKSTLLSLLSGVLRPSSGALSMDGSRIQGSTSADFASLGIARTFQHTRLFGTLSVRQNVLVSALLRWPRTARQDAETASARVLEYLGLSALADQPANSLSYGGQRRVEIARALALQPRFLLLDEPAAGMNPTETADLVRRLRALHQDCSTGIVVVDHDISLITSLCDRVIVLNEGRIIAAGPPREVQHAPAVIEAYLGHRHGGPDTGTMAPAT